jgi:transposase
VPHRATLTGILFVLKTGIPWQRLPPECGWGSGSSCWRRLRDWQAAGIWAELHFVVLDWLARSGQIDWSRAVLDSSHVRAVGAGEATGPSPVDRRKAGSKRHVVTDGQGTPLAVIVTKANRNDAQEALALLDAIPPLVGPVGGRPRHRPDCVLGDAAYGTKANREGAQAQGIEPLLAWRGEGHGSGLGVWRWVVERSFVFLNQFRRLRVRYERRADIHLAFLHLACAVIVWQKLRTMF